MRMSRAQARVDPTSGDGDDFGAPQAVLTSSAAHDKAKLFGGRSAGKQVQRTREEELSQQDQDIEELAEHVNTIGIMSHGIHTALQDQNTALANMDVKMQDTVLGLDSITRRTTDMVKKTGGPRPFAVIGCLIIIAIVLLCLIIYT